MLNEMIAEYWREDEQGEQHVNQVKNKTSEGIYVVHIMDSYKWYIICRTYHVPVLAVERSN